MALLLFLFPSASLSLCDLPVVQMGGVQETREDPFVVLGGASSWPAMKKWTPEALEGQFGEEIVKVGYSSRIVSNFGDGSLLVPLSTFLQEARTERRPGEEGPYLFDRGDFLANHPSLFEDFEEDPTFFGDVDQVSSSIYYFLWGGQPSSFCPPSLPPPASVLT